MSRTGWKVHYIIRESSGCNLVIQSVRDSVQFWFQELIRSGEFDECMELLEIQTNDRGRVVQERVTYSYSKLVGHVMEHPKQLATAKPTVEVATVGEGVYSTSLL
jgi:hypothetical protein